MANAPSGRVHPMGPDQTGQWRHPSDQAAGQLDSLIHTNTHIKLFFFPLECTSFNFFFSFNFFRLAQMGPTRWCEKAWEYPLWSGIMASLLWWQCCTCQRWVSVKLSLPISFISVRTSDAFKAKMRQSFLLWCTTTVVHNTHWLNICIDSPQRTLLPGKGSSQQALLRCYR